MILCLMPFPPSSEGHGGSQRAWYLLNALAAVAPVHLVLVYPPTFEQTANANLERVEPLVESVTRIETPEWSPSWHVLPRMPKRIGRWVDLARMGSSYAPMLSGRALSSIARQLPTTTPELTFAARLPIAVIAQDLMNRGLLRSRVKVVDFDDVQSRFQQREADADKRRILAFDKYLMDRLLLARTKSAESRIAAGWNAVSVCSDEDVSVVVEENRGARVFKVPNVIDKPLLPCAYSPEKPFTVLFVGNLSFGPNAHGLKLFIEGAWPLIRAEAPGVRMQVVGLNPSRSMRDMIEGANVELHANVPSVEPYYADADVVIAPIMFGGGTRVKILEAMAYGRPVVSTTIGAEGLNVEHGKHVLIADSMSEFAAAIVRLASSPEFRSRLATEARALQQARFGPPAINGAVRTMLAESGFPA